MREIYRLISCERAACGIFANVDVFVQVDCIHWSNNFSSFDLEFLFVLTVSIPFYLQCIVFVYIIYSILYALHLLVKLITYSIIFVYFE